MIPNWMKWNQKQKFNKCLINNGDGTFSLNTTAGSSTGANGAGAKYSSVRDAFDRTIQSNAVRVAS